MSAHKSLIDELEDVVANKDIGRRADVLRRITDLFTTGAATFSGDQIALFDEVMSRLVEEIEVVARAALGERLATLSHAPPNVLRTLALDDAIDVAGPVLRQSERLDEETLVEGARTKSQLHLLAISRRRALGEAVTDVLVQRGNEEVAASTAGNPGAQFSEFGYSTLVTRSENHPELARHVWLRPEIPRQHLLRLFATASRSVRRALETADRRKAELFAGMVAQAADRIQEESRDHSAQYAAAHARVQQLYESGELSELHLADFARRGEFDEAVIALSRLSDLPVGPIERAMVHDRFDQILVLARSIELSWDTTRALLTLQARAKGGPSNLRLEQCLISYNRLKPATAKKAIHFYRLRERASGGMAAAPVA